MNPLLGGPARSQQARATVYPMQAGLTPHCTCGRHHVTGLDTLQTLINNGMPQWEASQLVWSKPTPLLAYTEALDAFRRARGRVADLILTTWPDEESS